MANADPELRFKCLELAMKSNTFKVDSALVTAARLVEFVEQESKANKPKPAPTKKSGTTAKAALKTAGKTAAGGTKAQE